MRRQTDRQKHPQRRPDPIPAPQEHPTSTLHLQRILMETVLDTPSIGEMGQLSHRQDRSTQDSNAYASHSWSAAGTYQVKAFATDSEGADSGWSNATTVIVNEPPNSPPNTPSTPYGTTSGKAGTAYGYATYASDPDKDQVKYTFDWGDGTTSETDYVASGTQATWISCLEQRRNISGQSHGNR